MFCRYHGNGKRGAYGRVLIRSSTICPRGSPVLKQISNCGQRSWACQHLTARDGWRLDENLSTAWAAGSAQQVNKVCVGIIQDKAINSVVLVTGRAGGRSSPAARSSPTQFCWVENSAGHQFCWAPILAGASGQYKGHRIPTSARQRRRYQARLCPPWGAHNSCRSAEMTKPGPPAATPLITATGALQSFLFFSIPFRLSVTAVLLLSQGPSTRSLSCGPFCHCASPATKSWPQPSFLFIRT